MSEMRQGMERIRNWPGAVSIDAEEATF